MSKAARPERAINPQLETPTPHQHTSLNPEPYLNPEEPTLFTDLYKEIIIRNPKNVGPSGLRQTLNPKP